MEKLALSISGTPISVPNGIPTAQTNSLSSVLQVGFSLLVTGAIILALLYMLWGGYDWITSEGDKQKVNQARTKLGFAILGLIIVLVSFLLIKTLTGIFLGTGGDIPCGGGPRPIGHVPC